ncbi:MAG: HD domain-containing protein, partial [Clostridiales bacterium]|nr:HD domain-containing protein [Clostridiales bacterium]
IEVNQRREMCRLAISGKNDLYLAGEAPLASGCNIIDSINNLQDWHGKAEYYYIIGADKLAGLLHWSKARKLFKICRFIVYPRTGYDAAKIIQFAASQGLQADLLQMPEVTVTSAAIREKLLDISHISGMLNRQVERYININGLYQTDFVKLVKTSLSQQRFEHTLAVRKLAIDLAYHHHIWMQGASIASLLHDFTKEMKLNKMKAILRNYKVSLNAQELNSNALLHGKVASVLAKNVYGIHSADILNAIAYHTTGRAGMSPLELCVFVADKAEPGRKSYPGLQKIRDMMFEDLASAALLSMKGTRDWIQGSGNRISADSYAAIESMEPVIIDNKSI